MAKYKDILGLASNVSGMISDTLSGYGIANLAANARGLLLDLLTISIEDMHSFNARNYAYMTYHMLRNLHEKDITLDSISENAYPDGNPELPSMVPQVPSYTNGNNYYVDFMHRVGINELDGQLTTRVKDNSPDSSSLFNMSHKYFDIADSADPNFSDDKAPLYGPHHNSGAIDYTGLAGDRNSILFKMEKLYHDNKVNTIISEFYTNRVSYPGQVGTELFGESHGHNLLTEEAEKTGVGYSINGYENPYCRVWTHHNQYDRLGRTMRAKMGGINAWGEDFEWTEDELQRLFPQYTKETINGENYAYAWRGKKNQERRRKNSVLDYQFGDTGLPIITPKFRGGGDANVHTKSCMFSIENLAWKDYDPYAFEQALSWEQRGPFGGRIMWFPPYNIKISENATAKWNPNDFIGRGESVYTYVNSERTGSLSFTMLTDHPSSLDYSTWWQDMQGEMGKLTENFGIGNSENDYLRYFAGCMGNDKGGTNNDGSDNLIKKPQPMTDEYTRVMAVGIKGEREYTEEINENVEAIIPPDPVIESRPEKHPEEVEFFIFYPNNYTGIVDSPGEYMNGKYNFNPPKVNAILYLLAGRNAQKTDGYNDNPLDLDNVTEDYLNNKAIGYEMSPKGITTSDYKGTKEYIQGGSYECPWKVNDAAKYRFWAYRVDHIQEDDGNGKTQYVCNMKNGKLDPQIDNINTHNQGVWGDDLKDFGSTYSFNLQVGDYLKENLGISGENTYSFAEVAMAIYSENVENKPVIYNYLKNKLAGVEGSEDRVKKLIELFSDEDRVLESIDCKGVSNQHGQTSKNNDYISEDKKTRRNKALAENRRDTAIAWIRSVSKWKDVNNVSDPDNNWDSDHIINNKNNKINTGVSTPNAKIYRSARCLMKFGVSKTYNTTQLNPDPEKSKSDYFEMLDFWANDKGYTMGDVVQKNIGTDDSKDVRAYAAINDIVKPENDDSWTCPDVTDTMYWDELEVYEYKKEEHFVVGDYVKYHDYAYLTIKEVSGEKHFHQDAEFTGFVGFYQIETPAGRNPKWRYYKKNKTTEIFEQVPGTGVAEDLDEKPELVVTSRQIAEIFEQNPYMGVKKKAVEDNPKFRGEYRTTGSYPTGVLQNNKPFKWTKYAKGDIIKIDENGDTNYYISKIDFACSDKYYYFAYNDDDWVKIPDNILSSHFKHGYKVITEDKKATAKQNNMCYFDGVWNRCEKNLTEEEARQLPDVDIPNIKSEHWQVVPAFSGTTNYHVGDVASYNGKVYKSKEEITYKTGDPVNKFDKKKWDAQDVEDYDVFDSYKAGQFVEDDNFYECIKDIDGVEKQVWTTDIYEAIKDIINTECGDDYEYDGNYPYKGNNDIIVINDEFYLAKTDFSEKKLEDFDVHPFDLTDWDEAKDDTMFTVTFTKDDFTLQKKAATIMCWPEDEFRDTFVTHGSQFSPDPIYDNHDMIWSYGEKGESFGEGIDESTNLVEYAKNAIGNTIKFSNDEDNFLNLYIDNKELSHDLATTCEYITLYQLLGRVTKIVNDEGTEYDACTEPVNNFEELIKRTEVKEEDQKALEEGCEDIWVDKGDGILVELCTIENPGKARFNTETGEGDWNKLRYDQEYYFYRQYFADHPFIFDKLQDKIKYFQPAFHSMTPEGFNARLTFLQQCTRQGNTKTMSDVPVDNDSGKTFTGGKTANNLAFGRAPYCVLRLGDFYYQMIVIESINFDYSVSDGLVWDMNAEGNGMQPMLCNVSINFKFIGGGDITGPVRRLQNAMSFNYYANTSFYDNRADRVVYQHNVETMGGAGNNKVIEEQSYSFKGKLYDTGEKPTSPVTLTGTKSSDNIVK